MSVSPAKTAFRCTLVAMAASLSAAALGFLGLAGWALSMERLISIVPGYVTMKPNTALALTCGGLALAILSARRRPGAMDLVATALSLLVAALGALTLCEYALDWDPGFDRWLLRDVANIGDPLRADRMSPATAFCFVLAGCGALLYSRKIAWDLRLPTVAALAIVLGGIASLAMAGYAAAALLHSPWWKYAGMAIHTAAAFGLLAASLLALVKREGALAWALDRATTAGFILAAAIMLIASGLSYSFTSRLLESARWVSRTQEVLKDIQKVSSGMAELESGQRGFLITGDERLLDRRKATAAGVTQDMAAIRKLTEGNNRQQECLDKLEPLLSRRTNFGDRTIEVRRQQGRDAASDLVASGTGIGLSAQISGLLEAMQAEEYLLLAERQEASSAVSVATFLLLPLGVLVSLTILSAGLFFLNAGVQQRARAESALQESEQCMAGIVASAMDAIVSKDLAGIVTSWNHGAERMFGYAANEMIGRSITTLIPAARQEEEERILTRIRRGERVEHFETMRAKKDGSLLDVSVTVSPIKNSQGKITGASKVARDISDRRRAEIALRESERLLHLTDRRLAEIMQGMTEACFALDADWCFTFINDRCQTLFRHSREEMLGRPVWNVFPNLLGTPFEEQCRLAMRERTAAAFEACSPVDERWLDIRLFPTAEGLAAFLLDIHARKLSEAALRDSQARLSSALSAGLIGTWTWDLASDRLAADQFTAQMFSVEAEAAAKGLPAAAYLEAVLEADRPAVAAGLAEAIKSRGQYDIEYRVRQATGELRWLQARGRVECDTIGNAASFHGAVMDITERKRTEGRFRRLVESNAQGVFFWNLEGDIISANDAFLRMVGYSREDLDAGRVHWAAMTPPEYAGLDRRSLDELAASGICIPFEKEFLRQDGSRVPILIGAAVFEDNPDEGVCFVLDVSERKRADVSLREAEKEKQLAFEASRLKSEFLANMSHELRTPLNCILGFTEYLIDERPGALNPKQKEYLTDVYTSSRHLLQLINDVLDLAKVEAGKIELNPAAFPLEKAIEEVCAVVQGIAQQKSLKVAWQVALDLNCVTLDQQRFKQICYNLLSNAVKFTEAGGSVSIRARALCADFFEVQVADTGMGIRPEDIKRLFREFEQLDSGATRQFEGTGLGLALTRKLVEAHGGAISVESVYGEGSIFTFTMPVILNASVTP